MISIKINFDPQARRVIASHAGRPQRVLEEMSKALGQGLEEAASHLKLNFLSGTYRPGALRGGKAPLAVRSGALRQAVMTDLDQPLSGTVGVSGDGPAARYAGMQLGKDLVTITPRRANHLWIPIADNLNPSGIARMSPRDAMAVQTPGGKRALRFFRSRKGNLVAFLPDSISGGGGKSSGGKYTRGKKKGMTKGKLLFVLKPSVNVQGSDALVQAVTEKTARMGELLQTGINRAMEATA